MDTKERKSLYYRKWYEAHRDERVAYWRKYRKSGRVMDGERLRKWAKDNPEKRHAHLIVFNALRKGVLKREKCFCGSTNVEGHHPDYSKPLQVIWLCKPHHNEADRIKNENTFSKEK